MSILSVLFASNVRIVCLGLTVAAWLVGCSASAVATPSSAPTGTPRPRATPSAEAHMAHEPEHGGKLVMSQTLHVELVSAQAGQYRIYLYDFAGNPLPLDGVAVEVAFVDDTGTLLSSAGVQRDAGGQYFVAQGVPLGVPAITVRVRVTRTGRTAPDEIDVRLQHAAAATPTPTPFARAATGKLKPGRGACANDLFPAGAGNNWEYRDSRGHTLVLRVVETQAAGFTLHTQADSLAAKTAWRCQAAGLAATEFGPDLGILPTGFGWIDILYDTYAYHGLSLPAELPAEAAWEMLYPDIAGKEAVDSGHGMLISGKILRKFKVVGQERVRVPAGEYDAIKIQFDIDEVLDQSMHGDSMHNRLTFGGYSWFAPGVGCVKTSMRDRDGAVLATELQSYSGEGNP